MAAKAARARMKTSATDATGPRRAANARRQGGFTLIELLVTLTLAGLLLSIVPALSGHGGDKARLSAAARSVAAALALARSDAVMRNAESAFVLDLDQRRFGLAGQALDGTLDAGLSVAMTASGAASASRGVIRFYPNGGSDGGDITLRNPAGNVTLRVDWLSGAVTATRLAVSALLSPSPPRGEGRGEGDAARGVGGREHAFIAPQRLLPSTILATQPPHPNPLPGGEREAAAAPV
jgi:general secretion pathway protein H